MVTHTRTTLINYYSCAVSLGRFINQSLKWINLRFDITWFHYDLRKFIHKLRINLCTLYRLHIRSMELCQSLHLKYTLCLIIFYHSTDTKQYTNDYTTKILRWFSLTTLASPDYTEFNNKPRNDVRSHSEKM